MKEVNDMYAKVLVRSLVTQNFLIDTPEFIRRRINDIGWTSIILCLFLWKFKQSIVLKDYQMADQLFEAQSSILKIKIKNLK